MLNNVTIVGAGLAGAEAAIILAKNGYYVKLYECKPKKKLTPYHLDTPAELVCNNSMGKIGFSSPLGALIEELTIMESELVKIAFESRVDDRARLAVNKDVFSKKVESLMHSLKIEIVRDEVVAVPSDNYVIIATGPLTNLNLLVDISDKYNLSNYYFSDANCPIININSVNLSHENVKKCSNDLYVIELSDKVVKDLFNYLIQTETNAIHNENECYYDNCQTLERVAKSGIDKLVEKKFYQEEFDGSVILLRKMSSKDDAFLICGCITALRNKQQEELFRQVPGLEEIEFYRYGRYHQNTYFCTPGVLDEFYRVKGTNTFIVGQLSGIDGYLPAIASGLVCANNIIHEKQMKPLPSTTMIGALSNHVASGDRVNYMPMSAPFALLSNDYSFEDIIAYKKQL